MPKEMIYGSHLPYGEESPGRSVVEIRWDRESGYFQMATKCVHAQDDSDYLPPREPIEAQVTPPGSDPIYTELQVAEAMHNGFYVELDRGGINDLIRILRRARDQAFGRDE